LKGKINWAPFRIQFQAIALRMGVWNIATGARKRPETKPDMKNQAGMSQ
jgi:hypothetical protein